MILSTLIHVIEFTNIDIFNENHMKNFIKDFVDSAYEGISSSHYLDIDLYLVVNNYEYKLIGSFPITNKNGKPLYNELNFLIEENRD